MTPDIIYDQMIGIWAAPASWYVPVGGQTQEFGSPHRLRDAIENAWPNPVTYLEHSHAAMANAYAKPEPQAYPKAIFRGYTGADLPKVNPTIKHIDCPFTGEKLPRGDSRRNPAGRRSDSRTEGRTVPATSFLKESLACRSRQYWLAKRALVIGGRSGRRISDQTLAQCDDPAVVDRDSNCTCARCGAHPSYAQGYYMRDNAYYKAWDAIARDRDGFLSWMKANVLDSVTGNRQGAARAACRPERREIKHA